MADADVGSVNVSLTQRRIEREKGWSQAQWCAPMVPASREAEARGLFERRSLRLQ